MREVSHRPPSCGAGGGGEGGASHIPRRWRGPWVGAEGGPALRTEGPERSPGPAGTRQEGAGALHGVGASVSTSDPSPSSGQQHAASRAGVPQSPLKSHQCALPARCSWDRGRASPPSPPPPLSPTPGGRGAGPGPSHTAPQKKGSGYFPGCTPTREGPSTALLLLSASTCLRPPWRGGAGP